MRRAILGPRRWRRAASARPSLRRLRHAHALLESGKYDSAAIEFHDLAERGEAAGFPRSSRIYLLASHAYLLAGQTTQGLQELQQGLRAAAHFGELERFADAAPRITAELRKHGLEREADAFTASLESALNHPLPAPTPVTPAPRLPPKCPCCGGTIHPGEAEWADPRSIACAYCGSIVQAAEA